MKLNASQAIETSAKNGLSIVEFITAYGGNYVVIDIATLAELMGTTGLQRIIDFYKWSSNSYAKMAREADKDHPHRQRWLDWSVGSMKQAEKWTIAKPLTGAQ